jgi:hypothetical protein
MIERREKMKDRSKEGEKKGRREEVMTGLKNRQKWLLNIVPCN